MDKIDPKDLRVEIYSLGALNMGGAVRITHLPSSVYTVCDSECKEHEGSTTASKEVSIFVRKWCAYEKLKAIIEVADK